MRRGLLWLGAGLVALALMLVVTAPELLAADASMIASMLGVVLAAGIPGIVIVLVVAVRARRSSDQDEASAP